MKLQIPKRKKRIRSHRLTITLLFAGITFLILLVTLTLVDSLTILLVRYGVLDIDVSDPSLSRIIVDTALFSLGFGVIIAFYAGRLPLIPINRVINALNELADGNYSARLTFRGPFAKAPAIRELSDSFNRMAEELQNTEMLQSDFVNNFSHEFKTPIVSIAGFAKLLKTDDLTEEQRREYVEIIEEESLRLSQMATNVLNLTKIENQSILTNVTDYNLSEQLRNCVLLLEDKWDKKNLELDLDFDEYDIQANEELLKEVFINLNDNAVKFANDYGTLGIRVTDYGQVYSIEVRNTGSTIPRDTLDKIFNKFYQGDESHASFGNGIGLAIVKKIVRMHHGEVFASCTEDSTTLTVELPKTQS